MLSKNNLAKILVPLTMLFVGAMVTSCGSGTCATDNNKPMNPINVDLHLDYVGTVPVLNGQATSSYFYIHNDGDVVVNNISYSLANTVSNVTSQNIVDGNGFKLDSKSLADCSAIPAHSFCAIKFTTPNLSVSNQNNSLFKVTVKDANGFSHNFDQVINYSYYNTDINNGVNFATSADVVANITNKRYMMSYLVGGGIIGQNYNNVNLEISDASSISLNQGFISGQTVIAGELVPVEFKINIISEFEYSVNVTPQYVLGNILPKAHTLQDTHIQSGQSLYVNTSSQTKSPMALKVGVVPLLSAPSNEANGATIYVSNFGEDLTGLIIEPADKNVKIYNNSCTGLIESNASCKFVLGVDSNTSGNSEIYFKINGETILTKVVYYSAHNQDAMLIGSTPISQIGLQPNQSSSLINLSFANLGDYPLTDLIFTPTNGNTTKIKIINNLCGNHLESQQQCMVQVQVIGGDPSENGSVYLSVSGKSLGNDFTTQSSVIAYHVVGDSNLVISSPIGAESTLSILGNNIESANSVFQLINNGATSVSIHSVSLAGVNISPNLVISSNNCGSSLLPTASCQVAVKYGPYSPESNISGVANLQIVYGERNNTVNGTIKYQVTALDSRLAITNVVASGYSGLGSDSDPYHGSGCNNNPLLLTITYKNLSSNYVAQNMALNLIDGHVSPYMSVESSLTTCGYGASPKNLGVGDSCNLVLKANRGVMIDNSSFNLDVVYPAASWNTTQGFVKQDYFIYNGSNKIYANYTQPTLVSTITPSSGESMIRTVKQSFVGGYSCGDFTTKTSAFPYLESVAVVSGNCSINNDNSVICTNSSTQTTNVLNYKIDNDIPTPANLFILFKLQGSDKQIWYNPSILMFDVGNDS